jgi:hypothetical protein
VLANLGMAARAILEGHDLRNHMARGQRSILLYRNQSVEQLELTTNAIQEDLLTSGLPPANCRWFRPSGGQPLG